MSHGRNMVFHVTAGVAADSDRPWCDELRRWLDQVEDDRAHAEADRLRQRASLEELGVGPFAEGQRQLILDLADLVDPYEVCDGQLVRKSDGEPVAGQEEKRT